MSVIVIAATSGEATLLHQAPRATVLVTGIGVVNTAHALTRAFLTQPRPSLVIQTGIAGAYVPAGIDVGSTVLASEEVYADVGVIAPDGWLSAERVGLPLVEGSATSPARYNHFPLDRDLVARATAACGDSLARTGRFLTLSQATGVRALGDVLYDRFDALCESMEGAAAAHICTIYDVPFLEVRGISNLVENRDRAIWRVQEAANAAQRAVLRLLDHLDEILPAMSAHSGGQLG